MKKSSFVFIIMATIYFVVAILDGFGWMTITDNVLLGLSLSALLSTISDVLYNIGWLKTVSNEYNYIIQVTVNFLSEKRTNNVPNTNPNINMDGVNQYIKEMSKNYKNAIHPYEYDKKKSITFTKVSAQVFFIFSITIFILIPFLKISIPQSILTALTLGAFSAMCFNFYLGEAISEKANKKNDDFMNKEQVIIQTAYPDFCFYLNKRLQVQIDEADGSRESKE